MVAAKRNCGVMMSVVKVTVVVVVLCGAVKGLAPPHPQNSITLTDTGYRGVSVAISDQLNKDNCQLYIDRIKEVIQATSRLLFSASDGKVYYGEVVIVTSGEWSSQQQCELSYPVLDETHTWESSHFRLGPSHYLFGDHPFTQQPGGCGNPGDFIYLSDNFLLNRTMGEGIEDHILVQEWSKYRWGVFEEYGHTQDHIFPPAYRDQSNAIQPTYCTDNPLTGNMSCPNAGSLSGCQFTPAVTQNNTITSSLLSAPFIETVTRFCDSSTHNAAAPTKHNLLCDRSSTMDVISRHDDMAKSRLTFQNTTFRVVRATDNWPRRVLLVEYTLIMADPNARGRWGHIRDNVKQFIKKEAEAESYLGVVVFGNVVFNSSIQVLPLSSDANRERLAEYIPEEIPKAGIRNLYVGIQRGVEVLGPRGGTLVLLTHNLEYLNQQNLVDAARNNPVWPILYPSKEDVLTDEFDALADISPDTHVIKVPNDMLPDQPTYQSVQTSASIHQALLTAFESLSIPEVVHTCESPECTFPLLVYNASYYSSEAYIKVFTSQFDYEYVTVSVKDPNGRDITGIQESLVTLYPISKLQDGSYQVSISYNTAPMVVVELWVTPPPTDFEISAWSPKGLHNLDYSPGVAPRLLVKVTKNTSLMILFADITVTIKRKINTGNNVGTTNVTMNDEGFGADVTGRDGIYSAFLVGFEPDTEVDISISVTDNGGKATAVNVTQKPPPTTSSDNVCCGSQLDTSHLQVQDPGQFVYRSRSMSGRFTGADPGVLPPGRVTDLQTTLTGNTVTLHFTAPGAQLDQGTADWYIVNWRAAGNISQSTNVTGVPPGSPVESKITLEKCDLLYSITVVAVYSGITGSSSNTVTELVPCSSVGGGSSTLTGGAIAGITIGCLVGLLLIVLIVYLGLNSDRLDELWIWHFLTCRCCPCCGRSKKKDDLYSQTSARSDFVRAKAAGTTAPTTVTPIRTLNDLYAVPDVKAKREARQTTAASQQEDDGDGGFREHRSRQQQQQQKVAMKPLDLDSVASSRSTTLPINQVGLPSGTDNHAYDDGPYTIYSNVQPPPVPTARSNTQV